MPVEIDFPVGSNCFLLTESPDTCGSFCTVIGHENGLMKVKYESFVNSEIQRTFKAVSGIASTFISSQLYMPGYLLAKQLGIQSLVLSRITSSLQVTCQSTKKVFYIGLDLKLEGKQKKVIGLSRKSDRGWEYSTKAKDLIYHYKSKFPEVFKGLESNSSNESFSDLDFFKENVAVSRMAELLAWLKDIGVKSFDKVSLETEALPKDQISQIEKKIDDLYSKIPNSETRVVQVLNVPRQSLLKPEHAQYRLSNQTFQLGERIVHCSNSGSVSIGAKGTVIGIESSLLEVLFDLKFMSASNLGQRF